MVTTQITRINKVGESQTQKRHSDGLTLPYSTPNLDTMLVGVTDPIFGGCREMPDIRTKLGRYCAIHNKYMETSI